MSDSDLIAEYIELNPHRPGLDEARLKESGAPVWALIGYLPAVGAAVNRVAADYDLPLAAVEAALAYYHQHRAIVDARIAANSVEARPNSRAAPRGGASRTEQLLSEHPPSAIQPGHVPCATGCR